MLEDKKLKKLEKKYNSFVKKARKVGYNESANCLEHFLKGDGTTYYFSSDWLLQFPQVVEAVNTNLQRYENDFTERGQKLQPGESLYYCDLPNIEKDEIGPYGNFGWANQKTAGLRGRRGTGSDLYYASGTFTITTFCDVEIFKNYDGTIKVKGAILNIFWDKYDWHDNLSVYIPTVGIVKDSDAIYLEEKGTAKSYNLKSEWSSEYEKDF